MNSTRNQTARSRFLAVLQWMSLISILSAVPAFGQEIPVRLSFKFILDASGNRPATGHLNTDAEIDAQIAAGNGIFSRFISELRLEKLEVVDVAGVSQWYSAGPSDTTISGLSAAASPIARLTTGGRTQ